MTPSTTTGRACCSAFGTSLPSGVTAGTPATTTVSIADNDDPQVTVMFGQADAYTVAEGDTVTVTVTLSADPERTVDDPPHGDEPGQRNLSGLHRAFERDLRRG